MFSEKATRFDEISILILTLLSSVKKRMEISSNLCGLLKNLNFIIILLQEWEEKAREEKKRYEAENKLWLEDGGAEAIKAQKIANKIAKKEARRTNTVQGII